MLKPFPYIKDGPLGSGDVPINFYPKPDPARKEILVRTPGLLEHCQVTDCTEGRGIYPYQDSLYCIIRRGSQSVFWRVDQSGGFSEVGTISATTTGPVWIKDNPTQLGISDGTTMYVFTLATGIFEENTDADFPGSTMLDYHSGLGLYVKPNSNQWGFTGLYDFNSIDPLNFYSFESKTGNIVGLAVHRLEVYVLAENGGELWYFYGGDNSSSDNPTFARNTAGVIPYGCGAIGSINTADESMVNWISNQGEWIAAAGYQAAKISNQMMDEAVKAMPLFSDARAYSWRDGGHVFTAMSFPSGGQTWVYDWTTKAIFRMASYLVNEVAWGQHRLTCICKLNNELYGLDYETGQVYKISRDYFDDDTHEIQRVLHTMEFDGGNDDIDFGKMSLLMKMGIGLTGATIEPQVMYSFSNNSGKTYSSELWRGCGFIGEYKKPPPTWNRNGQSRKRIMRFTMTDAVDWEIYALNLDMQLLKG